MVNTTNRQNTIAKTVNKDNKIVWVKGKKYEKVYSTAQKGGKL